MPKSSKGAMDFRWPKDTREISRMILTKFEETRFLWSNLDLVTQVVEIQRLDLGTRITYSTVERQKRTAARYGNCHHSACSAAMGKRDGLFCIVMRLHFKPIPPRSQSRTSVLFVAGGSLD